MKIIRAFPRRTSATPDDSNVRIGYPDLFDDADEIKISVTWTWDKPKAEAMAEQWRQVGKVEIGGPAYDDPGGDFVSGMFVKKGYVFTSRGCPNNCWFCVVPKREGVIRELPICDGYNILDSNLLACSDKHILNVFSMLYNQPQKPRFTGGLEAKRMKPWIAGHLAKLKPEVAFFAYDTPDDWEPLLNASVLLKDSGALTATTHAYRCYVLIGWANDTIEKAQKRLLDVMSLGFMPMAMLFDKGEHRKNDKAIWIKFQREWASPIIVGSKMKTALTRLP